VSRVVVPGVSPEVGESIYSQINHETSETKRPPSTLFLKSLKKQNAKQRLEEACSQMMMANGDRWQRRKLLWKQLLVKCTVDRRMTKNATIFLVSLLVAAYVASNVLNISPYLLTSTAKNSKQIESERQIADYFHFMNNSSFSSEFLQGLLCVACSTNARVEGRPFQLGVKTIPHNGMLIALQFERQSDPLGALRWPFRSPYADPFPGLDCLSHKTDIIYTLESTVSS
jgi:hypothetical protein